MTIVELLVSILLMGTTFAVIGELVVLNTFASTKLTNAVDGEVGCSRALRRICEDVRSARIIGNVYAAYAVQNQFPDMTAGSIDPYNSVLPSGGWPSAGLWPSIPYKLGPQTLILQLPAYYQNPSNSSDPKNGLPLLLPASSLGSGSAPISTMENVDTVVYQLVPDPVNTGTYQLQVARFQPALSPSSGIPSSARPSLNPPQTILVGIIGPINPADGTNKPAIFQYLTNPPMTANSPPVLLAPPAPPPPLTTPPTPPTQILGVSVNVEVQTPASGVGANVQIAPAHAETYMRASRYLKQTNQGNWLQ